MKNKRLRLFIFIDAFGWQILQRHQEFLKGVAVSRNKLKTILGYSNGCDPSIISGKFPSEHLHWSSFFYSPSTCPYRWIKVFGYLPAFLTSRQRVRNWISLFIKKIHGFTGYFQIYQVPFSYLPLFDYAEKKRIWTPGGLRKGRSIFDSWTEKHVAYYVGDQDPEGLQWEKAHDLVRQQTIDCAYLLMGKLDHTMHLLGTHHEKVGQVIKEYDSKVRGLIADAHAYYEQIEWYVFSDHGMHDVNSSFDLQSEIESLALQYPQDYAAVYDSTMARFWYFNDRAKQKITERLKTLSCGRILSELELKVLGVYFEDRSYGETIFLMNPGVLIVPSFMGLKKIQGMHGYHPTEKDSYAMILSNQTLPEDLDSIEKIYRLLDNPL